NVDDRAASAGGVDKIERTLVRDVAAFERPPAQPPARVVLDDLGAPLERPGALLDHPARHPIALDLDARHVLHEPRQVAQVTPQVVDLLRRRLDRHRAAELDALAHRPHAVEPAVSGQAAYDETCADPRSDG